MRKKLVVSLPKNFSFKSTVFSHGWADLMPFTIDQQLSKLSYTLLTLSQRVYHLIISCSRENRLEIEITPEVKDGDRQLILTAVKRMFRLDDDYTSFYALAGKRKKFSWIIEYQAGRMLRCSSLWEDMVKMLCTTNCTWRLTQIMTENLVQKLGAAVPLNEDFQIKKAFPDAAVIASKNEAYLRNEIKMGYRAPYLLEFAIKVANQTLELDKLESERISTPDLYKILRGIKGFGDYAVSNLLKLLGRYDYLGADSWSRQKFAEKRNKGIKCDDKKIAMYYEKLGSWSGLFFWMDVSEEWYRREKPW